MNTLKKRNYQTEDDYWRIREFLRRVYLRNGRHELSWQAYRMDYNRWHAIANIKPYRMEDYFFLWETPDGQVGAVLHPEEPGEVFLQLDPDLRTPELLDQMFDIAERSQTIPTTDGRRKLRVWINPQDRELSERVKGRGYFQRGLCEHQRRRPLTDSIPAVPLAEGYTLRSLGDADELPKRSWVSWQAFHPDEPDENYRGWEWYHNIQRIPLYRRDLDLVAVAPDGTHAAFCTVWFDDVTRTGAFEPVGTAAQHQRKGLSRALMTEGLRRLQKLGATLATVGSYSPAAHALYEAMGFTEYDLGEGWVKESPASV